MFKAIERTEVTVSPTGDVSPSNAHAFEGSGEEGHTSDSRSVDSSHMLGKEEQTSGEKNLHPSTSNVVLMKSNDLLSTTTDMTKIESFKNRMCYLDSNQGDLAEKYLAENLKSEIWVALLGYKDKDSLYPSCQGISFTEESHVSDLTPRQMCDMLMFLHELGNNRGLE